MEPAILFRLCQCFIVFFSIWCGVYFGVYYYFIEDYKSAQCIVNSYTEWKAIDSEFARVNYRKLLVSVEIEDKLYPGFACEATGSDYSEFTPDVLEKYPYQFVDCSDWFSTSYTSCRGGERFLPRWLCTGYHSETKFDPGTKYPCYYTIRNGDGLTELQDERIKKHSKYIEASFKEGPYYPIVSYWVLMVLCLGLLSILPFLIILCSVGLKLINK